jgi:hypothetical protein
MAGVFACNQYIDAQAPWALRKTDPERMHAVLTHDAQGDPPARGDDPAGDADLGGKIARQLGRMDASRTSASPRRPPSSRDWNCRR